MLAGACSRLQPLGCLLEDFLPAPGGRAKRGADRRAGRWPWAAAPTPWLCPLELSEPLLPLGARAVMFFLPPTFESPPPTSRALKFSPQPASPRPRRSAPGSSERVQAWQKEKASAQVSKQYPMPYPHNVLTTPACLCTLFTGRVHSVGWKCPWTFPLGVLNFGT